jgi:large subunit ribosomal protein L35
MPKIKSNRGAAKRFQKTGTGRFKHRQANRGHKLTGKPMKRKRQLRNTGIVDGSDQKSIARMIPYS